MPHALHTLHGQRIRAILGLGTEEGVDGNNRVVAGSNAMCGRGAGSDHVGFVMGCAGSRERVAISVRPC